MHVNNMLRRHPLRKASNNEQHQSSTSLQVFPHARKRKSRKVRPEVIFKAIVAIEVIFLVCMWTCYSDRLRSSSLWRRGESHVHHPRNGERVTPYDDNSNSEDEEDDDEEIPAWERRLREEAREHRDKEREKHKQQQEARRELAAIGTLKEIPEEFRGPTLVIGGSDGSGTRAFARTMLKLGVPVRIDDRESLDIHGAVMFGGEGWPPLVKNILNATHSANYELTDLPTETETTVKKEMQLLKDSFDEWQLKFEQRYFVRQHMNMTIPIRATDAATGFKAPVTMLLLPLLKETFGKIKFLHIVRDGRDVALSTNKSPVQKFYQSMYRYPDADDRMNKYANDSYPVLAMNLWNDWNTQALEWEQAHASDPDFDYLVMRSEDFVDPTRKFETLARLAAFVGSPKTMEELCCMSREEEVDMGTSLVSSDVAAGDYNADNIRDLWRQRIGSHQRASPRVRRRYTTSDGGKVASDGSKIAWDGSKVKGDGRAHLHSFYHEFFHGGLLSDDDTNDDTTDEHERHFAYTSFGRARLENHRRLSQETSTSQGSSNNVHSRYGKWRELLKDKPDLAALLHKEGAKGLATFGYEPESSSFMDPPRTLTVAVKDFSCDESVICEE